MSAPQEAVVAQAIEWLVQQHSGEMTAEQHAAFARWRAQHPSHEQVCARLERTLGGLSQSSVGAGLRRELGRPRGRRQVLQGGMTLLTVAALGGLLYHRHAPLDGLLADLGTGTAQRAQRALGDGSQLHLNARTSVDLQFDTGRRQINLKRGRLYLEAQANGAPLEIVTPDGRVGLDGGRIAIAQVAQGTRVALEAPGARLWNRHGGFFEANGPGGYLLSNQGTRPLPLDVDRESAWRRGVFEIQDEPLAVLLEALQDYRTGILRATPEIAALRISGIFPLDDTDYSLNALVQTLPITLTRATRYWVSLTSA